MSVFRGLQRRHRQASTSWRISTVSSFGSFFRFNRRYSRHAAFGRLLGPGVKIEHITYNKMLVKPEAEEHAPLP